MKRNEFTASLLRVSADGLAGLAASRLFETASQEEGLPDFEAWKLHLRNQVLELAAALDSGTVDRFADNVAWARGAFAARKLSTDVLRDGLDSLRVVLDESLPEDASGVLPQYFDQAAQRLEGGDDEKASVLDPASTFGSLALEYVGALLAYDEPRATGLVMDAVNTGSISVADALLKVLTPALQEVGRLWYRGEATVADEHFATLVTNRLVGGLSSHSSVDETHGRTVVLTTVAGDAHSIGVQIVAAFFRLDGWKSLCLGANTPVDDIADLVQRMSADVVLLGATLNSTRDSARETIEILREKCPGITVLVGGGAFGQDDTWKSVGADGYCPDPNTAVQSARKAIGI